MNEHLRKPITVAIADDHTLIRNALANLIKKKNNYTVIFQARNGQELLEHIDIYGLPGIILLDINMPVMDGFQTLAILRKKYKSAKVIALTAYNDHSSVFRMSAPGINAYLYKTFEPEEILSTLDIVYNTGQYFPEQVNNQIAEASKIHTYRKIASLKQKELLFLKYACTGMSYKDIASKMFVSRFTIDDYRNGLFQKFELSSRAELVMFALKHKIVEVE